MGCIVHGLGFSGGFTGGLNALRVFSSVVRLFRSFLVDCFAGLASRV